MRVNGEIFNQNLPLGVSPSGMDDASVRNAKLSQSGDGDATPTAAQAAQDQASLGASSVALTTQAMNQPEVRQDLVNNLKAQIAAGTYNVSSSSIADAMLNDAVTGLGSSNSGSDSNSGSSNGGSAE